MKMDSLDSMDDEIERLQRRLSELREKKAASIKASATTSTSVKAEPEKSSSSITTASDPRTSTGSTSVKAEPEKSSSSRTTSNSRTAAESKKESISSSKKSNEGEVSLSAIRREVASTKTSVRDKELEDLKAEVARLREAEKRREAATSSATTSSIRAKEEELKALKEKASSLRSKSSSLSSTKDSILELKKKKEELSRMSKSLSKTERSISDSKAALSKRQNTVDLVFLVDCTGSMGALLNEAKNRVIAIAETIQSKMGMGLRISFVGYRDHSDSTRIEFLPFTTADEVKNFLTKVNATGGADAPEDIAGALKVATELPWSSGVRVIVHFGDAPCHGRKYHSCADEYPDGDPYGLIPEDLLRELKKRSVDYYFGKINNSTDQMVHIFKEAYDAAQGGGKFKEMDMRNDPSLFFPTVLKSVETSVLRAKPVFEVGV